MASNAPRSLKLQQNLDEETLALQGLIEQCCDIANIEVYRTGDPSDVTHADRSRLSALTKSIEEKQNALRPLLSRLEILMGRSEQQKRVNKAYLSSIRRLPREILSKIFLLVAAASSDHERRSTVRWIGGCMGGRYKFAEVCRMWRSVALGTAGLWTSVHLAIRESPAPFTWSFARFEAELKLTKMMPLDVRLSGMWHSTLQSHAGEAWRLLRQEAYRWRSLDLFDLADLAEILTESIDCPILEKLRAKSADPSTVSGTRGNCTLSISISSPCSPQYNFGSPESGNSGRLRFSSRIQVSHRGLDFCYRSSDSLQRHCEGFPSPSFDAICHHSRLWPPAPSSYLC